MRIFRCPHCNVVLAKRYPKTIDLTNHVLIRGQLDDNGQVVYLVMRCPAKCCGKPVEIAPALDKRSNSDYSNNN